MRRRADVLIQVLAQPAGETGDLPVDLLRWLLALSPILLLLVLLVVFQWGATEAGPLGVAITVVVAAAAFQTPLRTLVVAGAKGVWDAVPILLVIFAALLLYRIGTAAGAFHALRTGVEQQSRNSMFLVLAFGWVFASFTQGIAGFGAPIAIVAPILVALRVRPVYAVVIPLIGHAWAKFFGTLGVGWVATLEVTEVEHPRTTALLTSLVLLIPSSRPAATAVVTFLVLASVMSYSGQTEVLALGIAAVAPPLVYAFVANIIGIVGALVTNSSTSSNVLFAPVHTTIAANLGISQAAVLAAQSTGGAVGNVVAPTNIILGTTTAGISGKEGEILRKTIPWAATVAVLTGLATIPLI
jgi:L-lactate permease